jgi:hypothetical protein
MQLKPIFALALLAPLCMPAPSSAQSLSPMHGAGPTPSDTKAFRLRIGNPYKTAMTFVILPMDPDFQNPAEHAAVQPREVRLAPGASRSVLAAFRVGPDQKERTIGVCVQPKAIAGTVLPRVCGTYTGVAVRGARR